MDTLRVEREEQIEQLTLMMISVPLGFMNQLMGFVGYHWDSGNQFRFFQWQRTYDRFSWHLILFDNPKRAEALSLFAGQSPESLASAGTGIQFMIVFNH